MKSLIRLALVSSLLLTAVSVPAQVHVGPTGYFNSEEVIASFWVESGEARAYLAARDDYQEQRREVETRIQELRADRADAREDGDSQRVTRLSEEIDELSLYAQDIAARWELQEEEMLDRLAGDAFWTDLYAAMKYVAESRGFLSILDTANNPDVFYYAPEVDLTRAILDEMIARSSQ